MEKEFFEKIEGIINQDISMFENTPFNRLFCYRKKIALRIKQSIDVDEKTNTLIPALEGCENIIRKKLLL